ncbi:protein kibra [Condylostylus longicornis]|uniref:protein kibra n=1 Tax=Condylostylus longicornis TaxID=2530218 RepID=UPI00244DB0C3|nr:protein kibra [Condylostylus longicornis]
MPKQHNYGELPAGWDIATDYDGKVYYIDHNKKETTWLDPRDRYTKPQSFEDCIGDELPHGWEESYDPNIGRYYIDHIHQTTQLEDPRQEWKSVQEAMLREYLNAAQDVLEKKKEIYDVKKQRLCIAQDEYNHLNTLAASRSSLCSSSSSINTRPDPELLKVDLVLARERVRKLKQELNNLNNDISYTQRGVDTLYSVEQKLNAHETGCYDISEVQAIREEMINIHKMLVSGEKVKEKLMQSLVKLKNDLTRQQYCEDSDIGSSAFDRVCVASQTDLCAENMNSGAKFAEMAKTKLQYSEWRKRIKQLQQQLADHAEKIEPGQLESDKDRLLLIQEKDKLLKELRSILPKAKNPEEIASIQKKCKTLEEDLNSAHEATNICIAYRLQRENEKQNLIANLQEALKSTKMLEARLRSFSSESTFSISSGSSVGSLSTASSKSALSFPDIYGDLLTIDPQVDVLDLQRRCQRLSQPSEISLSPRSSLSMETPPASPMKYSDAVAQLLQPNHQLLKEEPTYANANFASPTIHSELDSTVLDCVRLEERLHELEAKQPYSIAPLSPIYEKPSLLDLPQDILSRSSSTSNTRSVSAAVSNESVAGDSGVFEASRALHMPKKELAQVQIGIKYSKAEGILFVTIERARNLVALDVAENSQIYLRAALLPNSLQSIRTKTVTELQKPVFGESFSIPISLSKILSKVLQVTVVCVSGQKEEIIGTIQISLAEFNPEDSTLKWYNILSSKLLSNFDTYEISGACKEESSDESTIISSQTSTLTRNQGHALDIQAQIAEELKEHLNLNDEVDDDDDEDEEDSEEHANLTQKMLDAYMSNVKQEYVDKETNTECAFPPEKCRANHFDNGASSSSHLSVPTKDGLGTLDERHVKRSQTFSPSAAVAKNRYICRLNRSDSDSAMHFGGTPHPFQRGAVERRSLRFHTKTLKPMSKIPHAHIPRTSLDLELDRQAQHSKLNCLNDEISKLKNLKETLEQALDNKDFKVATWAIENEDFQRLVGRMDPANSPEEKQLQKLLHKTSKEIYKLRKTKVAKGAPDLITFKEKIAFFTRKGLSVPELPTELVVTEESNLDYELKNENLNSTEVCLSINENNNEKLNNIIEDQQISKQISETNDINDTNTILKPNGNNNNSTATPQKDNNSYEYIVDRTYGVEV